MYKLINTHSDAVIEATAGRGDLSEYSRLVSSLRTCSPAKDRDFQRTYRAYWRMNAAHLGQPFYQVYFTLLGECTRASYSDIADITKKLKTKGGRGPQFSFATKLAHMINPRLPVYDSYVAAFYFYQAPVPQDSDLESLFAFYRFLKREYKHILSDGLLDPALARFRRTGPPAAAATDERLIDWLIWGWVSMMRKRDRSASSPYD
jgi:hypothetical protein